MSALSIFLGLVSAVSVYAQSSIDQTAILNRAQRKLLSVNPAKAKALNPMDTMELKGRVRWNAPVLIRYVANNEAQIDMLEREKGRLNVALSVANTRNINLKIAAADHFASTKDQWEMVDGELVKTRASSIQYDAKGEVIRTPEDLVALKNYDMASDSGGAKIALMQALAEVEQSIEAARKNKQRGLNLVAVTVIFEDSEQALKTIDKLAESPDVKFFEISDFMPADIDLAAGLGRYGAYDKGRLLAQRIEFLRGKFAESSRRFGGLFYALGGEELYRQSHTGIRTYPTATACDGDLAI